MEQVERVQKVRGDHLRVARTDPAIGRRWIERFVDTKVLPGKFLTNFRAPATMPLETGKFSSIHPAFGLAPTRAAAASASVVAATVRVARTLAMPPPAATSASGIICGSPAVAVAAPGTKEEGAKAGDQAADVRRHHYVRHRSTIRCKVSFKYFLSFWSSFSASGDDFF